MDKLLKLEKYQLLHNSIYWCGMIGIFILLVKICFLECPALTSKFIVLLENSCPKINASIADMMIRRNVESYTIPLKISAREEAISSVDPMTSVT